MSLSVVEQTNTSGSDHCQVKLLAGAQKLQVYEVSGAVASGHC